jgi:hypothetical protein
LAFYLPHSQSEQKVTVALLQLLGGGGGGLPVEASAVQRCRCLAVELAISTNMNLIQDVYPTCPHHYLFPLFSCKECLAAALQSATH